jgi:hypothetical protein
LNVIISRSGFNERAISTLVVSWCEQGYGEEIGIGRKAPAEGIYSKKEKRVGLLS